MGSSKQVALTPAFLNKLSEIVNDPKTDDLIKWSVAGDSFYVYDEKLFSTQVLPYWFKHENYPSFHLQKGVLKSEPGSEYAHFAHPNFRRAQPDLLRDIQRNKNSIPAAEDETDERESAALPTANAQVLDIHTINTIQRHQATISAEQSELKRNNELLWQEMQAARARQQKQEDTINRIVKFLAGVFAGHGSPVHKEDVGGSPPSHAVVPLRQATPDDRGTGMTDSSVHEVESPGPFAAIETPSVASPMEPVLPDQPASMPATISPTNVGEWSITPCRSPSNVYFDNLVQGAQIQQLMNSINSTITLTALLTPYQHPLDFGSFSPSLPPISSPLQSASLLDKADIARRGTEDIEQDIEAVDFSIDNLIQHLQIPTHGSAASSSSASVMDPSNPTQIDSDLFNSFLDGIGDDAFLDEVPSASHGTKEQSIALLRKRKSDAAPADVGQETPTGTRAKRRREA
ncbi:hypothetical protein B0H14DRAFT_2659561 [Mycena olivaceomarginata]|nr:hypothetical protein B0H14DRAFT_2659561 [Mycena olivaceomarginata]